MIYNYLSTKQKLFDPDIGLYTSYGIILQNNNHVCINGISCRQESVTKLVKLLNRHQANPLHLRDIIEDFID